MELRSGIRKRKNTASSPSDGGQPRNKRQRTVAQPIQTQHEEEQEERIENSIEVEGSETDESSDESSGDSNDDEVREDDSTSRSDGDKSEPEPEPAVEAGQQAQDAVPEQEHSISVADGPDVDGSHVHKDRPQVMTEPTIQALRRVERAWNVQDINTFLPPKLKPDRWGERIAKELSVLARHTGSDHRDWTVQELERFIVETKGRRDCITLSALEFVYAKGAELGKFRDTSSRTASKAPTPAQRAVPTPPHDQPPSTSIATSSATQEAPTVPESVQGSPPSARQLQQRTSQNRDLEKIASESLGVLQHPQRADGHAHRTHRNALEELAHVASRATPRRLSHWTDLQLPRLGSQSQQPDSHSRHYTSARLTYLAPPQGLTSLAPSPSRPRLPNGANQNDTTRGENLGCTTLPPRNQHPVSEASKDLQDRDARGTINSPIVSPELGNTPESEASLEPVEGHGGRAGSSGAPPPNDSAVGHHAPPARPHESASGRAVQAALSVRPQLNLHYPPRSSELSQRHPQQRQFLIANHAKRPGPASAMPPPSIIRSSEDRVHQLSSPSSSLSQPRATSRSTSISGDNRNPSSHQQHTIQRPATNGNQTHNASTTPNTRRSTASTAPGTPMSMSGVNELKRKLDDIRQESAKLRQRQLHAVHFLKLEIETVSDKVLAKEEEVRLLEESISNNSARIEEVGTEIANKEKTYAAVKRSIPTLEKHQAHGVDITRDSGGDCQDDDLARNTLLFRCVSDHTDAYHETLVMGWAKHIDGSARNGEKESSEPNGDHNHDHGRNNIPAISLTIPPSCLYALFLRSSRQQLTTLLRQLADLNGVKERLANENQASLVKKDELVSKIVGLKKDREDLMEELTKFGEEAGIQVQGL